MRLDKYLVINKLVNSREHAKELIETTGVLVNNKLIKKVAYNVKDNDRIQLQQEFKYVSRAGYKLEHALKIFNISVKGKIVLDLGSSTGGFVDVLLQNNAKLVYAVERGKNLLAEKIATDKRVINLENLDAKKLKLKHFIHGIPQLITMDLSREHSTVVLKKIHKIIPPKIDIILLLKPQFELNVPKNTLTNTNNELKAALNKVKFVITPEYMVINHTNSPITGKHGQKEILVHLKSQDV